MDERIFEGHENTKLLSYGELDPKEHSVVKFSELGDYDGEGVLKGCFRDANGELTQLYSDCGSHVGVIAATRLGKTTSYVIPAIISYAKMKNRRSMIISDPKGELYRKTANFLKERGYTVRLLNFRDYAHTEFWNPLTPIYRKYRKAQELFSEVDLAEVMPGVFAHKFRGRLYSDEEEFRRDFGNRYRLEMYEVENEIDAVARLYITTVDTRDPTWEDGARELLKAFLFAMLEDSDLKENPVTEDTYSMDTIFTILSTFTNYGESDVDKGYFTHRGDKSRAYRLAKDIILSTSKPTASSYVTTFQSKLSAFTDVVTRKITSCNSFDLSKLADEGPVAIFLSYRDELKIHFETITLFVKDAYRSLIDGAMKRPGGRLETPFCFMLDEFGNFARIQDFDTVITACAGRNIWFTLIMQSYAQLESVYENVAQIVKDNLNVHIFMGSNNTATLEEFSRECGQYTRVSPLSYMNSRESEPERVEIETVSLMPKSRLAHFAEGECTITEANCGYVLLSKLERYFKCPELMPCEDADDSKYASAVSPTDDRYIYSYTPVWKNTVM
ncbi:MAG: type IV secretory system conjugative DNA transfer family protein [Clostridia bacterium]|nr:type IV secretory system conjugative DNA transfer family protein [Clostridia bacterium]